MKGLRHSSRAEAGVAAHGKRVSPAHGAVHELVRGPNSDELDLKVWAVWSGTTERGGQFLRATASYDP